MNVGTNNRFCRLMLLSGAALATFCTAASPSRALGSNWPAIGIAQITYTVTSTDWAIQSQTPTDNGTLYSEGIGYVKAEVWSNNHPATMAGSQELATVFAYTGTGTPDTLYDYYKDSVSAYIGTSGQLAYAQAYIEGAGGAQNDPIDVINDSYYDFTVLQSQTIGEIWGNDGTHTTWTESAYLGVGAST